MQKENQKMSYRKAAPLYPGLQISGMTNGASAFTLIELLVVVLIIGILAAVAVSQYEKAVWKSRVANMRTTMRSIATAQNAYFLANNTYASSFDELSLDFDNFSKDKIVPGSSVDQRHDDWVEYRIYKNEFTVLAYFISGKYKGCGLDVDYQTGEWNCRELFYYYKGAAGGFCQKIVQAGPMEKKQDSTRYYPL